MKAIKYMAFLMMGACAMFLTSCSDDEEEEVENVAAQVAGSYEGMATFAMAYGTYYYSDQAVTLTEVDNSTVTFVYEGSLGSLSVDVAGEKATDGSFAIVETETTMSMDNHSGGTNDYDTVVSGTISADKSDYSIVITWPSVMGGTVITLAPATEE